MWISFGMHIDLPKQEDSEVSMEARLTNDPRTILQLLSFSACFVFFVFIHYHYPNTIRGHYLSQVITLMIVLIFPIISNSHKIKFLIPNFIHWSTNLTNDLIAKVNQSLNFLEKFQSCNLGKLIRTICWAYIFYNNKCLPSKERKRNIFFWVSLLYLLSDYIG